jgi:hypothetical protein
VPREVYANFSEEVKLLYRHLAEGEEDVLQSENQYAAIRARESRESDRTADNSHIVAGAMKIEEWESNRAENKS